MKKAMRDLVRALVGFMTLPGSGVLGSLLLANGTASASEPPGRFDTAHPAASRPSLSAPKPEPPSRAETTGDGCFDQHELGQELRQSGKLLESRAAFARCARRQCPAAVQRDCELWSSEVAAELPSVMFRVSVAGQPRSDARVVIDGQWRREAPAQPVTLDPGLHDLRVSAPSTSLLQRPLELRPGARERLDLELKPLPEASKPASTLSWVLGGVGLAGTASFVAFGLSSRSLEQDLEQRCAPLCSEQQIDRVRQRSIIANVSLGLGVSSLAAAGALYLLRTSDKPEQGGLQVAVAPARRGAGAMCNVQVRAF